MCRAFGTSVRNVTESDVAKAVAVHVVTLKLISARSGTVPSVSEVLSL
jgi:hypothetical protein